MAFSGLHVICAEAGDPTRNDASARPNIITSPYWSETLSSAGTTTQAAPPNAYTFFRVVASADTWIAIGSAPDASQALGNAKGKARHLLPANQVFDINVNVGDKLAWIAA